METTEKIPAEISQPEVLDRACASWRRHWPWVLGGVILLSGLLGLDRVGYHISVQLNAPATVYDDFYSRTVKFWDVVRFPASLRGGLAAFFLLLVINPATWRRIVAGLLACLSADLLGSLLKMTVARARPDHAAKLGDAYLVFHPFHGFARDAAVSFPSGEATAAFALATVVTLMYPRLKWPCYILAAAACLARLIAGAHYLSDVAAGAMIGTLVSGKVFSIIEPRVALLERLWQKSPRHTSPDVS